MSKRLSILSSTRTAALSTLARTALALTAVAMPAEAQTAAELALRKDSVERRYALARVAVDEAQNRARAVPDDSLLLHGNIVRFNSANFAERERRSITRAFNVAAEELTAAFGPEGVSLLEGQAWLVTVSQSTRRREAAGLGLEALEGERRVTTESLELPLNVPDAVGIIRRQAGRNLARLQPRVWDWVGGAFRLAEPTATHYFAHRQLALHESSPARRCARGNIPACTDILDPTARARWFDSTDAVNRERVAASGVVRQSVLRYAVEADGPAVLRAFRAGVDSIAQPVPFLAAAVGQQPEQFVRDWQRQLAASGAVRVRALPRTVYAALGWFALCGIIASRRRPQ